MDKLRAFINSLPTFKQERYARRSKTSIGYIRKMLAANKKNGALIGEDLAARLAANSDGALTLDDLRPQQQKAA